MKFIFIFIFLFKLSYSQQIKGFVFDSNTNETLEFVNVIFKKSKYCVFTNFNGEFSLNLINKNSDSLYFSCVGYETGKYSVSELNKGKDVNIYLNPRTESLREVIVVSKAIDKQYTSNKRIKLKSTTKETNFFSYQFGTEHCVYVLNESGITGKIQSVTLDLMKIKDSFKECEKCEIDYITDFSIKFYEYNQKENMPGKELYVKPVIVSPQNKTYRFEINVDTLNIPFPSSGVCVGIEYINTKYENPKQAGAFIAPCINLERYRALKKPNSWVRYRYVGSWIFKTAYGADKKSKYFDTVKIDLKVKFEKE